MVDVGSRSPSCRFTPFGTDRSYSPTPQYEATWSSNRSPVVGYCQTLTRPAQICALVSIYMSRQTYCMHESNMHSRDKLETLRWVAKNDDARVLGRSGYRLIRLVSHPAHWVACMALHQRIKGWNALLKAAEVHAWTTSTISRYCTLGKCFDTNIALFSWWKSLPSVALHG